MTDQLYLFLLCVLLGAACGIVYDALFLLRTLFRQRAVRIICDILFCLFCGAAYLALSVSLGFPSLRLYFALGLLLGLALYLKSFHKTVAFFADKVYNRVIAFRKEREQWHRKKRAKSRHKHKTK